MGFPKFSELEFIYEYDFATDGGATAAAIPLRIQGANAMGSGLVVEEVQIYIETAFTSGGSATVVLGNSVDEDGYLVDFFALASLDAAIRSGQLAGALLWDNTNDNELSYVLPSAAGAIPKIKVGTAALTAGKAKFVFKCKRFV